MREKPWSDLQTLIALIALYRRLRPHLVHHVTAKPVLYGTIAARLNRVPAVVNAMMGLGDAFAADTAGDHFWRLATITLFRMFVRHPRMLIIIQNRDDLHALLQARMVAEEKVRLIRGSGVDPDYFIPSARGTPSVPTVLCTARVVVTKGIVELVEAARQLRAEGVRARFVLAGDRDTGSGKTIADASFDPWVRDGVLEYAGLVDDVRVLYAAADIACLPSWREGLPKALLEAASCALPIVTTDVPGCREVVLEGESGFLVPVRAAGPLAAALRKLIEDAELRATMGKRGRQLVIEEFSLQRVIEDTLAVYAELG
jgi:glycosyltransferase involved in cell wall biosynthesis